MTEELKDKIEQGKLSLQERMETLRPFLPKPDMVSPQPTYRWKLEAGEQTPTRDAKESTAIERAF